jgi:hypothetical protein
MGVASWLEQSALAVWVSESPSLWAYPAILTLHTVGMTMLVGASVAIDVRLLGFVRELPAAPLRKLFPLMWIGFWINAVSGSALFIAHATEKAVQPVFYAKLGCVAVAMATAVLMRRRLVAAAIPSPAGQPSSSTRTLALTSIVMWAGAITAGRLMAYL